MFFSFDGVDGAGKSTQIRLFCDWLRELGHDVITCRDPGSTRLGESLRGLVLNATDTPIHRRAETLLYMAARAQMVEEIIRPALAAGQTVVSDRFVLANVVYQGHAGGLDVDSIWSVGRFTIGEILPDLVFLLDIDAEKACKRFNRATDRMESQGLDYMRAVRAGFLAEAEKNPSRIVVVDADQPIEVVQAALRSSANRLFEGGPK